MQVKNIESLQRKLKEFNAHSRNTEDHFKLCTRNSTNETTYEIRLCSTHPRLITCTPDSTHIHVMHHGPSTFHKTFSHDMDFLRSLLTLLHSHRDDGDSLLEWELEDWVSAGYPCKLYETQELPLFPDLGFMPEDLWCIDEQPSRAACI